MILPVLMFWHMYWCLLYFCFIFMVTISKYQKMGDRLGRL